MSNIRWQTLTLFRDLPNNTRTNSGAPIPRMPPSDPIKLCSCVLLELPPLQEVPAGWHLDGLLGLEGATKEDAPCCNLLCVRAEGANAWITTTPHRRKQLHIDFVMIVIFQKLSSLNFYWVGRFNQIYLQCFSTGQRHLFSSQLIGNAKSKTGLDCVLDNVVNRTLMNGREWFTIQETSGSSSMGNAHKLGGGGEVRGRVRC